MYVLEIAAYVTYIFIQKEMFLNSAKSSSYWEELLFLVTVPWQITEKHHLADLFLLSGPSVSVRPSTFLYRKSANKLNWSDCLICSTLHLKKKLLP